MARASKKDPPAIQQLTRLRAQILQLAVQGKLVPQDETDESASVLLKRIAAERDELIKKKQIKKPKPLPAIDPDEVPYELPQGWEWARLGALWGDGGIFEDGDWVETKDQDPNGEVRLTQLADVGVGKFRDRSHRFLTAQRARELGCTFLQPDDVMIARMPDPLGRACLFPRLERPCVTVVDVCILRTGPDGADSHWLMWAVNAPGTRMKMDALTVGATRNRISRSNLGTVPIGVPPIAEQQRIVAKVDELMAAIDELEAYLRRVEALRPQILQLAVQGKLVRQDETEEDASVAIAEWSSRRGEWIASSAPDRRNERANSGRPLGDVSLPSGWQYTSLDSVAQLVNGRAYKKGEWRTSGDPVLRIQNLNGGTDYYFTDLKLPQHNYCEPGDLLFAWSASFGPYLWPGPRGVFHYHIWNVKCSPALDRSFGFLLLGAMTQSVKDQSHGMAMLHMTKAMMEGFVLPIPPLAEQHRIVAKVDELMRAIDDAQGRVLREEMKLAKPPELSPV